MLVLVWPSLGALLLPIIVVEAAYARRALSTGWRQALTLSVKANVASTVLGVPLAWGAMLLLAMAVFIPLGMAAPNARLGLLEPIVGAAWISGERGAWQLPLAAAVLCVPFYFISVFIERWVAARTWPMPEAQRWSVGANRLTYGAMVCGLLVVAAYLAWRG